MTNASQRVLFRPDANENGSPYATFGFKVNDGTVDSTEAVVTVNVTAVNDDPVAVDDTATVAEDSGANAIDVLANDNDGPDTGETLTVTAVTQGANGTVTFTGDAASATRRNANFFGTDSFTYTISDGNGGTDTATVNVTVTNVNDDPVANDDTATVAEDAGANAIDVLANDNDGPDAGETLTVTAVDPGRQRHGRPSRPTRRQLHAGRRLLRHRQLHLHDQRRQRRHRHGDRQRHGHQRQRRPGRERRHGDGGRGRGANAIDVLANDNDGAGQRARR